MVDISTTLYNNGNISYNNEMFLVRLKDYSSARRFIVEHKKTFGIKLMYWIEKV